MKLFKKGDFVIIAIIIIMGILISLSLSGDGGKYIEIICDGELYGEYSLSEDKNITVKSEYGWNEIVIRDRRACVIDASCKDKLDVAQGQIYKAGQSIICLPNRLSITVKGREEFDALSY